ncbi:MAG TPA: glycosyltransferase [Anaerolineaceae bacterium]
MTAWRIKNITKHFSNWKLTWKIWFAVIHKSARRKIHGISFNPPDPSVFDARWYLQQNPDIQASGLSPLRHYVLFGWKEGRNPNIYFDIDYYYEANPELKQAGVEPLTHYLERGWKEKLSPSPYFDASWYLEQYPDVAKAGIEPFSHYLQMGWKEGRSPSRFFDLPFYLEQNSDVRQAGQEPLAHYIQQGWKEGRNPNRFFDLAWYQNRYPDVKAMNIDPLRHYMIKRAHEARERKTDPYPLPYFDLVYQETPGSPVFTAPQPKVAQPAPDSPPPAFRITVADPIEKDELTQALALQPHIPVTYLTTVYNEENRIKFCLEHAVRWADEIIVINKSSTDHTREICESFGDRVKIVDIPYSPSGHNDIFFSTSLASYDWIYHGTASEIPTRKLIATMTRILNETQGELDLIYVPRKLYSLGIHSEQSVWHYRNYPFLTNRKKTIYSNQIHDNFHPRDLNNTRTIPYADDCCVYHCTHVSARSYLLNMIDYFMAEAKDCKDPDQKIRECMALITEYEPRLRAGGKELFGHYCSWAIYQLGTAMFVWEKERGIDVEKYYRELKEQILQNDWLRYDQPGKDR